MPPLSPANMEAANYCDSGDLALNDKKWSLAIQNYSRAIELSPDLWAAHFGLGNAYVQTNQVLPAIKEFSECIRICPEFGAPWYWRGLIHEELHFVWWAIRDYLAALKTQNLFAEDDHNARVRANHLIEAYKVIWRNPDALPKWKRAVSTVRLEIIHAA